MKKKSVVHNNIGPVIVDLIEELEIQLDQELYSYYNTDSFKSRLTLPATAPMKTSISDEKTETLTKSTSANTSISKIKSPTSSRINIQVIEIQLEETTSKQK